MGQEEGGIPPGYRLLVIVYPDAEADAAASHFTLQNLRPGTAHRVGVQEVTAESKGTCGTWWRFQTKALGNGWRRHPLPSPHGALTLAPKRLPCPTQGCWGLTPQPSRACPQVPREQRGNPT